MRVTSLTAITIIIFAVSTYYVWTKELIWLKYTLIIIFLATIIGVLLLMPLRLTFEDDKITLHRFIDPNYIPSKDIIELMAIPNSEIAYSIRLFGSGGLFGYLEEFYKLKYCSTVVYMVPRA